MLHHLKHMLNVSHAVFGRGQRVKPFKSLIPYQYFISHTMEQVHAMQKNPEREGFEPSVPFRVHTTSNRTPSAARSSLQKTL